MVRNTPLQELPQNMPRSTSPACFEQAGPSSRALKIDPWNLHPCMRHQSPRSSMHNIHSCFASPFLPKKTQITKPLTIRLTPRTDLIAPIQDPEHPLTLGSLSVVNLPDISISPTLPPTSLSPNGNSGGQPQITTVTVLVTPTITHCSLATVIGLGVRVRLEQALPPRFRVDVRIKEGTHSTAEQVNRQLGDKERVAAALENGTLMSVLRKMLDGC